MSKKTNNKKGIFANGKRWKARIEGNKQKIIKLEKTIIGVFKKILIELINMNTIKRLINFIFLSDIVYYLILYYYSNNLIISYA